MPIYHEIADNKYIVIQGEGLVTGSEIIKANAELYSEIKYKNVAQFQLWDLTALTNLSMSSREHQEAAQQDKDALSSHPHIAVAIAGTADQVYGVSSMYVGYAPDGVRTRVFRSRAEAEKWILEQIAQKLVNAG
jgi:hypothetical protein